MRICTTAERQVAEATSLELGDRVKRLLSSVGITPDRYVAAKRALGLPPTCGCEARKEWLNRAGEWWSRNRS
ncbi:MAG: hypothetical protein AAGF31_00495 [Planctomycetota bacterium]